MKGASLMVKRMNIGGQIGLKKTHLAFDLLWFFVLFKSLLFYILMEAYKYSCLIYFMVVKDIELLLIPFIKHVENVLIYIVTCILLLVLYNHF